MPRRAGPGREAGRCDHCKFKIMLGRLSRRCHVPANHRERLNHGRTQPHVASKRQRCEIRLSCREQRPSEPLRREGEQQFFALILIASPVCGLPAHARLAVRLHVRDRCSESRACRRRPMASFRRQLEQFFEELRGDLLGRCPLSRQRCATILDLLSGFAI